MGKLRRWIGFALVSLLITLIVVALTLGANVRDFGVADRYPDDYVRVARFAGPLAVPILPFFRLFSEPILHLATVWLAGALLVAAFLVAQRRGARRLELPDLLLALALLASLFHLFAAMALILVFATARYDLWRLSTQPKRRLASIGAILAVVVV